MAPSFHEMRCISGPRKLVRKRLGPDAGAFHLSFDIEFIK